MMFHGDCDDGVLHANGVGNPGAQFDIPPLERFVTCQR
jgi:hypothetical protein